MPCMECIGTAFLLDVLGSSDCVFDQKNAEGGGVNRINLRLEGRSGMMVWMVSMDTRQRCLIEFRAIALKNNNGL